MNVRIGVCAPVDRIESAARAGFDYIELNLNEVLNMEIDAYRAMADRMEKCDLYAEVVFGMLPDGMEIIGSGVSAQEIHRALDRSFETARALGAEIILLDCAASRRIPRGFDPAAAWRQMGNLIRIVQGHAARYDLRAAILPLCRRDADLINRASEAMLIPAMLNLDRVGVAASGYHMAMESESVHMLRRTGGLLWHVRTSNALGNRLPKAGDGQDYRGLLEALRDMDYSGRITCEGKWDDFDADARAAHECMHDLVQCI